MKPINELRMTFPSRSANEAFARAAVAAFVAQLDPAVDELADLRTAVSEAVTNAIVHAYPDGVGTVVLTTGAVGTAGEPAQPLKRSAAQSSKISGYRMGFPSF